MKILRFSSTFSSFIKYFVFFYFSTTLYYTLIYKGNVPKKITEIVKRLQKLSKIIINIFYTLHNIHKFIVYIQHHA